MLELKGSDRVVGELLRSLPSSVASQVWVASSSAPLQHAGEVLIEVNACGICAVDAADIEGADPTLQPSRVPGHEVAGRIPPDTPSIWK